MNKLVDFKRDITDNMHVGCNAKLNYNIMRVLHDEPTTHSMFMLKRSLVEDVAIPFNSYNIEGYREEKIQR